MQKREIKTTGIVGVELTLNHSEMIVLKGFVSQVKELKKADPINTEHAMEMLNDITKFINNVLPENVMSIDEAYTSLFAAPLEDDKEPEMRYPE